MYKDKVVAKQAARGKSPIIFKQKASAHATPSDALSDEAYSALVESLIDDEDNIESEFSMLKCVMIEDGTYYA